MVLRLSHGRIVKSHSSWEWGNCLKTIRPIQIFISFVPEAFGELRGGKIKIKYKWKEVACQAVNKRYLVAKLQKTKTFFFNRIVNKVEVDSLYYVEIEKNKMRFS